jgi:hypothetical protein
MFIYIQQALLFFLIIYQSAPQIPYTKIAQFHKVGLILTFSLKDDMSSPITYTAVPLEIASSEALPLEKMPGKDAQGRSWTWLEACEEGLSRLFVYSVPLCFLGISIYAGVSVAKSSTLEDKATDVIVSIFSGSLSVYSGKVVYWDIHQGI